MGWDGITGVNISEFAALYSVVFTKHCDHYGSDYEA